MGLTRLLSRPREREQEPEDEAPKVDTDAPQAATEAPKVATVLAFANQKGGVAKTTSTLNLAAALGEQGFKVLCIDMDPQGNLTMSQGLNPDSIERSMFDVLVHRLPIDHVIHQTEVDLAVSSIDLAGAELALSSMIGRERALEKALMAAKNEYDYILIDTPPILPASESLVMARAADAAVLCARRDYSRIDQVAEAHRRLEEAGVKAAGAVLNGIPSRNYAQRYGSYYYNRTRLPRRLRKSEASPN